MRIKAALVLGLMMLALTGACGGNDDSDGVASVDGDPSESAGADGGDQSEDSFVAQAREYAQCMRDNGIEDYPDPEVDDGNIVMQGMTGAADDPEYIAAEKACEDKAPGTGEIAEMDPETLKVLREFSKCMRDNGITGYPDPDPEGAFTVDVGALGVSDEELAAADEKCAEILEDTFEMENS